MAEEEGGRGEINLSITSTAGTEDPFARKRVCGPCITRVWHIIAVTILCILSARDIAF